MATAFTMVLKVSLPLMDQAFATSLAPASPKRKAAARTALVGLNESARALLSEGFRQFGIETVVVTANAAERLKNEKFEACVLSLGEGADSLMEAARSSPSNSRCVIYGVGGNAQEAMSYSKYGINAIFSEPLERPAALKLIRGTRMLVLHEFRRYVRIPVLTEVSLVGDGRRISATSIEMSTGGMSLKSSEDFSIGANIEVSFSLMTLPRVNVKGVVSWRKPKSIGVRFDSADKQRQKIRTWIDSYLEN
jgi:Tfp pilus assembly protein PilZ